MNNTNESQAGDVLNTIGQAILSLDTRWLIIAVIGLVAIFCIALKWKKKRFPSRDDAMTLALTLLQLYSAPVLLCMLVLTQPPAVDLVGNFQRQGAGLLAFIFLIASVFIQIKKFWTGDPQNLRNQPHQGSHEIGESS